MTDATVTLAFPLEIDGKTISEISLRRPKVKDLRAMDRARQPGASELDQGIVMASTLCGLPLTAMDDMDAGDFAGVSEAVSRFLTAGSTSGE